MSCPPYFSGVLAALVLTLAACDTQPPSTGTLHADSAGIPVATAISPQWEPGEAWTVDELLVEIGTVDGSPEYQLADVVAAVRLDNGDIVVADRGASQLRGYDAQGTFRWRAGREGEGPGEFLSLDFLGRMAGDSLVVYDGRLLRVQVFDPVGTLVRTFRAELQRGVGAASGSAPDRPVGLAAGRLILRFVELPDETAPGVTRWIDYRLVAIDLRDGAATSLIVVDGEEVELRQRDDGRYTEGHYVFGSVPEFGAAAGSVAVIDTEAYQIRLVSAIDGRAERIVHRDVEPAAATDAVFESHLEGIMDLVARAGAPPEQADAVERMWREYPRAPTLPVLRSIHVDETGNLWLTPYFVAGAEPLPFEVHAPDGTWLGSVSLPPGLERGFIQYQAPYMEIGSDYILGVWTDELDVQYVRMYRLNR